MPEVEEQDGLTLGDYVQILRKNWLLILLSTVLATAAAGAYSFLQTPQYQASTELYVSVRSADADGAVSDLTQGGTYARQAVLSYVDVIETASVLRGVIDDLGLDASVGELREMVSAKSPSDSVLIDIDVLGPDPALAAEIANSVAENFTDVVTTVLEKPTAGNTSPVQISVVEEAETPTAPVSPNIPRNVALGFLLGLLLGIGLAVLRTALDTRVRTPKDLLNLTDVPTLGAILDDPKANRDPLVVHSHPRSPRSESFRSLRTNLQFVNVDGSPRTFVITSSAPGEGKTTVSTNLAISLAQSGATVALVDADMRKPSVATRMGLDGSVGLSSLLAGMVEIEDVIHPWGKDRLFVLPAGRIPPNPSELLGSVEMKDLLARLAEHFDYVIIDTPPVLAVTDAAILSGIAGGTIVVAALGLARKNEVRAALDSLDGIANRVSGIVVTHTPSKGPDSYYYTRYEYANGESFTPPGTQVADPLDWLNDGVERQVARRRTK